MDVKEKLRISLLKILNSNDLRLFGCLIYNFDIELINTSEIILNSDVPENIAKTFEDKLTASVTVINGTPKMIVFSKFAEEKEVGELIFVILHEVLHILGGHCIRRGERDHQIYNLAGDHVINKSLIEDIKEKLKSKQVVKTKEPKDAFVVKSLINRNLTTEEVYDILKQKSKIKSYSVGSFQVGMPTQSGDGDSSSNNQVQMSIQVLEVNIDGKTYQFPVDTILTPEGTDVDNKTVETVESLKAEARAVLNNDSIIGKGNASGSVADLIKKMIEVEIPWTTLLDRAICSKIVPDSDDRSWRYLQKRFYTHGLTIPGIAEDEKPATLVICEDQSGSVSDQDIKKFASVIMQSIKYFDQVRVIKHDVKIHSDETIDVQSVTIDKVLFEALGRGGTSHKYVFQEIEDAFNLGEDEISLVLLLTDFESDIERIWNKYEWTKEVPVSVVLTDRHSVPKYVDPKPILIKSNKD